MSFPIADTPREACLAAPAVPMWFIAGIGITDP